jgi:dCTP deaminase
MVLFLMLKNDRWILEMASKGMIEPFNESLRTEGVISSGVGSYGYDMRIADEFKIFRGGPGAVTDPKNTAPESFEDFKGDVCVIPPNSFVLGRSVEYFRIPRDVLVISFGKSTYARSGVFVNVTPLEPEWEGHLTISVSNTSPSPVKLYANEGIAQLVFLGAEEPCHTSYADRAGKYQAHKEITHSKT